MEAAEKEAGLLLEDDSSKARQSQETPRHATCSAADVAQTKQYVESNLTLALG